MSKKITIKQALDIWEQEKDKIPEKVDIHPDSSLIHRIARGLHVSDRDMWIRHLIDCAACRNKWINMMQDPQKDEYVDIVLSKVAGGGDKFGEVTRITSQSGKYLITFRKDLEEPDSCLITLNVLGEATDLEDRKVVIRAKNGRRLLEGKIFQGELSGWIKELDDIDISFTSIIMGE